MLRYAANRIVQTLFVLLFTTAVVFLIVHLIPGDPAETLAGPDATPDTLQAMRQRMGLSQPLVVQYGIWLRLIVHGEFGTSFTSGYSVSKILAQRFPATLELTVAALLLSIAVALPVGVIAAVRHGTVVDAGLSAATSIGLAIPEFWSGLLFLIAFAVKLKWFPPGGRVLLVENPLAGFQSLILPSLTLAIPVVAALTRFVRGALLEVLPEQYIRTAYAKGLQQRKIILAHALRNSLIPVITVIGVQLGQFLGGAVLVETIFNWPGIGLLMVVGLKNRDYSVVQATLLVMVVTFSLVNLFTDLLYGLLDPRIRVGESL